MNYFKLLILVIMSSLLTYNVGYNKALSKFASIEVEEKEKVNFLTAELLKKENKTLVKAVDKKEEEKKEIVESIAIAEVIKIKKYYFLMSKGSKYQLRTGGTVSWRYNNPGKLLYGSFAKRYGAIGYDGALAIFPDIETGRKAFEAFLFDSEFGYKDLSVSALVKKLSSDIKLDVSAYQKYIITNTKISASKKLNTMTADDRENLLEAIATYEGFIEGNVYDFKNKEDFEKRGW